MTVPEEDSDDQIETHDTPTIGEGFFAMLALPFALVALGYSFVEERVLLKKKRKNTE